MFRLWTHLDSEAEKSHAWINRRIRVHERSIAQRQHVVQRDTVGERGFTNVFHFQIIQISPANNVLSLDAKVARQKLDDWHFGREHRLHVAARRLTMTQHLQYE